MGRVVSIGVAIAVTACGRLAFDPRSDATAGATTWLMTADYFGPRGDVAMYAVDPETGDLRATEQGPVPTQARPTYFGASRDGAFVHLPHESPSGEISGFAVDPVTGSLTSIEGSPFAGAGGGNTTLRPAPDETSLYTSSAGGLQCFQVAASGQLTATTTPPIVPDAFLLAIDPLGRFVYSATYSTGVVHGFRIAAATCGLTSIGPATTNPTGDVHGLVIDPQGRYLVVLSTSDLTVYSIAAGTGEITRVQGPYDGGGVWAEFDPQGEHLFVAAQANGVRSYRFDAATGAMNPAPGSPLALAGVTWFVAVDDAGRYVYAAHDASPMLFRIVVDRVDGSLSATPPIAATAIAFAMDVFTTGAGASSP